MEHPILRGGRAPSIRRRILLLTAALAIPAAALQGYLAWRAYTSVRANAAIVAHEKTEIVAAAVQSFLSEARQLTTAFAAFGPDLLLDPTRCGERSGWALPLMPMFASVFVVDESGQVVCSALPLPDGTPVFAEDRTWFRSVMATGQFTLSEPIVGRITERAVVVMAAPIRDDEGSLVGAAATSLALEELSRLIASRLAEGVIFATISDTAGVIVTRSDDPDAWLGTQLPPPDYPTLGSGQGWEVLQGEDLEGGFRIIGRVDLEEFGYRLYAGLSSDELLGPGRAAARRESVTGIGLLALAFLLATWLYRDVGKSLDGLVRGVRVTGTGERIPMPPQTATEIRAVADALNSMLEDRKRAEGRHREFLHHAPFGVCSVTPDGSLLDVNPALAEMLGYGSPEEVVTAGMAGMWPDEHPIPDWLARLEDGLMVQGLETVWVGKAEQPVNVRLSGRTMDSDAGAVLELIVEDVTERTRLEQVTRHQQKTEAIGRLAGGVAHEINNILGVISGYARHLVRGLPDDSATRAKADEITQAVARGAELTRKLLIASRRVPAPAEAVDVSSAVTDLEPMLRGVLPETIELRQRADPAAGQIWFNRGHLDQILLNLVINARDAMPDGGVLTISTARRNVWGHGKPLDQTGLIVEDTGTGMDAATLERVFEPFFTTKPPDMGTGLGLAMVAGLVEQGGGEVRAESESGRGSTFEAWFPVTDRQARSPEAGPREDDGDGTSVMADSDDGLAGSESILLVEDEPAMRALLRSVLEHAGYRVTDAGSAEEALELAEGFEAPVDAIVTDVILPGINGPELVKRLGHETPHLYISGYTADHLPLGADTATLLPKPFGTEEFLLAVRRTLTRASID